MLRLLPVFLAVAIWVYALVDCVRTPEDEMPYRVPKVVWIILVVIFPFIGAVAWIIVSRMARSQNGGSSGVWSSGPAKPSRPGPSGPVAPDDDPEFLFRIEQRRRREAAAERRRQAAERGERLDDDGASGGGGAPGDGGSSEDEPGEDSPGAAGGGGSTPDVDSPR